MSMYVGDYPANHTAVLLPFNSYNDDNSSPIDVVGFTSADVKIYKNGGTTERTSANGITVSNAFDGIVGFNLIVIDLSDNTDAGFYAAGNEYLVGIVDITIDDITARKWVGSFSIERAGGALALIKLIKARTDTVANVAAVTGAVVDDALNSASTFETNLSQTETDHWKHSFLTFTSGTLVGQTRRITAYNGSTKFVTTDPFSAEPSAADAFAIINK